MLIGIEGDIGSGKTIYAVRCALIDSQIRKIIANFNLIDIPYETFNIKEFLSNEYNEKLFNASVFIDEITLYMDCRLSSSKQNLLMGYLVLQSRKRGLDIYYTTQDLNLVDYNRLVRYTNLIVYAEPIYIKDKENKTIEVEDYRNYTIIDLRKRRENITQFNMRIEPYFKYYDTNQIIEPMVKWNKNEKTK